MCSCSSTFAGQCTLQYPESRPLVGAALRGVLSHAECLAARRSVETRSRAPRCAGLHPLWCVSLRASASPPAASRAAVVLRGARRARDAHPSAVRLRRSCGLLGTALRHYQRCHITLPRVPWRQSGAPHPSRSRRLPTTCSNHMAPRAQGLKRRPTSIASRSGGAAHLNGGSRASFRGVASFVR